MNPCVAHLSGNHRKEATTDRILVFSCSVVPSSEAYEGHCIQRRATAPSSGTQLSFVPAALVAVGPWTSSLAPWNSGTRYDARQEGQELISWTKTRPRQITSCLSYDLGHTDNGGDDDSWHPFSSGVLNSMKGTSHTLSTQLVPSWQRPLAWWLRLILTGCDANAEPPPPPDLRNLTSVFFAIHLAGGHIGLPILVATFLLSKTANRHPTVVNFCIIWILYSIIYSLL